MPRRGAALLLLALCACLGMIYGRRILLKREEPPAFFVEDRSGVAVQVKLGGWRQEIHQFRDATRPLDVIKMTGRKVAPETYENPDLYRSLRHGEAVEFGGHGSQVTGIKRSWMPAGQRIALGIPLHPDRMSLADWEALPGIGPGLARRIEEDRQENGDFGSWERVQRVRGIGPKRILQGKKFFLPGS